MSKYIDKVISRLKEKNANEPEFLQTVEEVLTSVAPVVDVHPEYEKVALLERMCEPERTLTPEERATGRSCVSASLL